jgi:hypothetical protein
MACLVAGSWRSSRPACWDTLAAGFWARAVGTLGGPLLGGMAVERLTPDPATVSPEHVGRWLLAASADQWVWTCSTRPAAGAALLSPPPLSRDLALARETLPTLNGQEAINI